MSNVMLNDRILRDAWFQSLDALEKWVFVELLIACGEGRYIGIFEYPLRQLAFDTGIEQESVLNILSRFAKTNKVHYVDEKWIIVTNRMKNQNHQSNDVRKGMHREILELPENVRELIFDSHQGQFIPFLTQDHDKLYTVCTPSCDHAGTVYTPSGHRTSIPPTLSLHVNGNSTLLHVTSSNGEVVLDKRNSGSSRAKAGAPDVRAASGGARPTRRASAVSETDEQRERREEVEEARRHGFEL